MRFVIRLLTIAAFCTTVAMAGCGPANTDPKPVGDLKKDPRIQRVGDKGVQGQTILPAK
jgi:hypothetical protein